MVLTQGSSHRLAGEAFGLEPGQVDELVFDTSAMERVVGELAGPLDALKGAWRAADQKLGGWLPGGGVPSPATKAAQQLKPRVAQAAAAVRDQVVIPAIDKGIQSGVLPTKEAMFARYLSGTSQPLTVYPDSLKREIKDGFDQIAITQTRDRVNQIHMQEDPLYRQLSEARGQLHELERTVRERAESRGSAASGDELSRLSELRSRAGALQRRAGVSDFEIVAGEPKVSDAQRLAIIRKHGLADGRNQVVGYNAAYGTNLPRDVMLSLGSFEVKDGTITDRYKFDDLKAGREVVQGVGSVYPDAMGGGKVASDLIEMGLRLGVIKPDSGYDIRVPLR